MCVLHVTSETMSFANFLEESSLPVYQSHEKGDVRKRRNRKYYDDYGFSCDVSKRDWLDLVGQIEDAHAFLSEHGNALLALISTHEVDDIRLDFPYECKHNGQVIVQCDYLPPKFIQLAGKIGIGIELSLYPRR